MKSQALYPYHTRVSNFAQDKPKVGIFVGFGGGKTYLSLKWLEDMCQLYGYGCRHVNSPLPALVLTLKTGIHHWGEQIEQHSNFTSSLVRGTGEQRVNAFKRKADIYVTSYDLFRSPKMLKAFGMTHITETTYDGKVKHYFRGTERTGLHTVIVDESTSLKNVRAQRFKALRVPCVQMNYRAILTGKPILERADEIWGQMLFLDDGETFGGSFWRFRNTYFSEGPPWDPYTWTLKPGAEQKIAAKLDRLCIRISEEEVSAQLPPKRYIKVPFEMPKSVRRRYEQLRDEFCMEKLDGDTFETKWAPARSQKMHQLCQGIFYKEANKYELVHTMKLDWLQENIPLMLKEGPTLIWTHLVRLIPLIAKVLSPIPLCIYKGEGMNNAERDESEIAFKSGKVDLMILSERMGYAGLDLWRANQAVFYSTDYPAGFRDNAEDRCHRIGSEIHEAVTYYDLVFKDSMDEVVLRAIQEKLNMTEEILKHIRRE